MIEKYKFFSQITAIISLVLYLVLLTWIIVFKFRLDFSDLAYIRSVNLIPFRETGVINGISGNWLNVGLFVPLGMYLEFLQKGKGRKIGIILLVSLTFETLQYVFHIGISDTTDVIMNFTGGVIGMIIMRIIYRLLSDKIAGYGLDVALSTLSFIIPISMMGLLLVI